MSFDAKSKMEKTLEALKNDMNTIRTGRANAAMFDKVRVDYYGQKSLLNQVAQISIPEARTVVISPFDKSLITDIEKAISAMADENDKYSFVDSLEIDLRNNTYFDVSQWEGSVKPVKAILSIRIPKETTHNVVNDIANNWNKLGRSSNFDVNLTIGNMIFLMEDGTFRTR